MWNKIKHKFEKYPAQGKVAQKILSYGLRVVDQKIRCGDIGISASAFARAIGVDRRVITTTINTIDKDKELAEIFSRLWTTCHFKDVAQIMGWGALEIVPIDATKTGILSGVAAIIASANISIRQVIADDPEISDNPRAFIITETPIPSRLIPKIKAVEGVESLIIH